VDLSFAPVPGANDNVWTLAVQPDGKVVIGGRFTTVNGVARNRIARLNPDGSLDPNFNPGAGANGEVQAVRLDVSGRVLVGGSFSTINGTNRAGMARLNANGSLDLSFNPGSGANGTVWTLAVQTDGRVLVGGAFTTVNGNSRNGIARLTATGAIDDTFVPGAAATNGTIYALAVQADGRILIGGSFASYAGTPRTNIARLNSNGTLDGTYNPGGGAGGVGNSVNALALQSDGRAIVAGDFTTFDNLPRKFLARLGTNGAVDPVFIAEPNLTVRALAVQPDNRVLMGGDFDNVATVPRAYVARLLPDGNLDATYDPGSGANDTVEALGLQADGRLLLGGWFNTVQGQSRNRIARLHNRSNALSPVLSGSRVGGDFRVSFSTLTNTAYLLEYTESLSTRAWLPLAMLFGDGSMKQLTDPNPRSPQRFYRIRTLSSEPYLLNPRRVGNVFSVDVPAFAWRTMILEYKNSLNDAAWTALPGVAGDNTIKTLTDATAAAPTRVYRVRAQ
jgi:uncharacterized delta-60 repeat protein